MEEKLNILACSAPSSPQKKSPTVEELDPYPWPPVLSRTKSGTVNEDDDCLILFEDDDEYLDPGEDTFEPCTHAGEDEDYNNLCSCRKMQGRQYYDYYREMRDQECYKSYPKAISTTPCTLPKGAILHFTGASNDTRREDINGALVQLGAKVMFVDYQKGDHEGWVRLSYPHEARVIIKKMTDRKLKIKESEVAFTVLSKKVEKRYMSKVQEQILKMHQKKKSVCSTLKKAGYNVL